MLKDILYLGKEYSYNADDHLIQLASMFGYITEKEGRKHFMLYIKPIINGTGNYYIEAETRDGTRTDMIIDYLGHQYVIEMKIWCGNTYHERGEKQLLDYLDHYHTDEGYMLSFCFNKKKYRRQNRGIKRETDY